MGDPLTIPVILMMIAERAQVGFKFLVDALSLAIRLRVVRCQSQGLNAEEHIELVHEVRHELSATVVKPCQRKTMELPEVLVVELCSSLCSDSGMCRNKVRLLGGRVTSTITTSKPCESGSSVMKSMLTRSQRPSGVGSGLSSPIGWWRMILLHRQVLHVQVYWPT